MEKYYVCPVCKHAHRSKKIAKEVRETNKYVITQCVNCGQKLAVDVKLDNKRFDVWRYST